MSPQSIFIHISLIYRRPMRNKKKSFSLKRLYSPFFFCLVRLLIRKTRFKRKNGIANFYGILVKIFIEFNLRDVDVEKDHEVMIRLHVNSVYMRLCFLYNKMIFVRSGTMHFAIMVGLINIRVLHELIIIIKWKNCLRRELQQCKKKFLFCNSISSRRFYKIIKKN